MGFRTVVVLNNDMAGRWEKDPQLGEFIRRAMMQRLSLPSGYGRVVECEHSSNNTVFVASHLDMESLYRLEQVTDEQLVTMNNALDLLGYKVVKKRQPTKKKKKKVSRRK